jgi:thiol-disulfide isomerase/thioredoxin
VSTPQPGDQFPDLDLPDHSGNQRRLSELAAGDPLFLNFYRGFWCPKEQAFFRKLVRLQDEAEVAYTRFASASIDPPEVAAAFRVGLGPAGRSFPTPTAATRPSSTCWRQPTPSTGRTCRHPSCCSPICGSTRRGTATGSGDARPARNCAKASGRSPG